MTPLLHPSRLASSLLAVVLSTAVPSLFALPERLGDLDEDGIATVFDLTRLIGHINAAPTLPASQALFGDMDEDGDVDQVDVQLLRDAVLLRFELPEPTFNYLLDATPENVTNALFTISGTSIPGATVMVEGATTPQTVVVGDDGTFSVQVNLKENQLNRLYITVFDDVGNASPPRALQATHDTEAPKLFIDFPSNNSEVFTATADIAGRVGDTLSGYRGLDVKVQGENAEVIVGIGQNGTFERGAIPLDIGKNVITVSATDALGNTVTKTSNVFRREPIGPVIEVSAGNNQQGVVNDVLSQPATVKVRYPNGTPIANKLVSFKVIKSNGMLAKSSNLADFIGANLEYQAITDSQGLAKVHWRLGHDAGCGNNRLQASSKDVSGVAYFCASANAAPPTQINIGSGNNQRASVNSVAVEALRVWVNDSCNGAEDIDVLFRVVSGDGKVNGSDAAIVKTSRTGHAGVAFKLGPNQGNNIVVADFVGNAGPPATFVLYGMAAQQSGDTSWDGIVFDNDNNPIGGAACHLEIGGVVHPTVYTDESGVFKMTNLPSGPGYLHVDGLTATTLGGEDIPAGSFPELHYEVLVVKNAANSLGEPVLLPPLDPINAQLYDNQSDLVLTCEGIEGLKMTIKAGSMRLPNGTKPDWRNPVLVSLNQVHHDDAPMPMPDGVSPPFAWTLQPAGSTFDPPVTIEYPNMKGLAPGAVAYFLSYDHDMEEFVIAASGHVTDDGSTILTDQGAGLSKAGWGCNCPPYSVTADCENCALKFSKLGDKYGYDDFTNKKIHWKSVEVGQNDTVRATISQPDDPTKIKFVSSSTSKVTVSPSQAASASQTVTVTGVAKGTSNVNGKLEDKDCGLIRVAAYNKKSKTVAVTLIHEKAGGGGDAGYTSTDIGDAAIAAMLKTVYKQAVMEWTVVRRPALTVEFDLNKDGKVDVDAWMSAEMAAIRDAGKSAHDYNVFLVDKPSDGSSGFMSFNQKYGYIHADHGNARTVAHELGHGQGLQHTPNDELNIMYNYTSNVKEKLRKSQWDHLQP